jgi:hypothetical protein
LPGGRIVLDQQYGCHHLPLCRRARGSLASGRPPPGGQPVLLP